MKRIAILLPVMYGGGAERVASILSQYFYEKKYLVYIFTDLPSNKKRDYEFKGKIVPLKIQVEYPQNNILKQVMQIYQLLLKVKKVKALKKQYGIDISISFMEEYNLINVMSKVKDKTFIRVCTILSVRKEEFTGNIYYHPKILKFIYNRACKVIVMTNYAKNDLVQNYGIYAKQIQIIPNPLFLENKKEKRESQEIWEYGSKAIVSVARLEEIKQQQHIIRSFSKALINQPDAKLVFVGNGSGKYIEYLKKLIKELKIEQSVNLVGRQKNIEFYLTNSKAFVLTSKTEGFPNSMLEALEVGIPVISSDCPGAPREILHPGMKPETKVEQIVYGEYGILVPHLDGKKYSAKEVLTKEEKYLQIAMEEILSSSELENKYRNIANDNMKKYAVETIGNDWEILFRG